MNHKIKLRFEIYHQYYNYILTLTNVFPEVIKLKLYNIFQTHRLLLNCIDDYTKTIRK
jgi:hypothetical protein